VIQNTCVDVIVNGKKVQEKVLGYIESTKMLCCSSSVNNGLVCKKRTYRCYKLGENDYYWLHSSIDERFWIIPEQILYENGYISKNDEIKPRRMLKFKSENSKKYRWIDKYQYRYSNIDKEVIMNIFK
jgi:hypothetical protein